MPAVRSKIDFPPELIFHDWNFTPKKKSNSILFLTSNNKIFFRNLTRQPLIWHLQDLTSYIDTFHMSLNLSYANFQVNEVGVCIFDNAECSSCVPAVVGIMLFNMYNLFNLLHYHHEQGIGMFCLLCDIENQSINCIKDVPNEGKMHTTKISWSSCSI